MKATSLELENLLAHLSGQRPLTSVIERQIFGAGGGAGKREPLPADFLDSFGKKEFFAGVCFIDMRGFSDLARDKSPSEVRALVAPFIGSVVRAATFLKCFVDKTIGDEVMLVMPITGVVQHHSPLEYSGRLLAQILWELHRDAPQTAFSAGMAFGTLLLDEIRTESYSEWTVYGNCVNGAKRLQSLPDSAFGDSANSLYRAAIGAVEFEMPHFEEELKSWLKLRLPPPELHGARVDVQALKGVGRMSYMAAYLG